MAKREKPFDWSIFGLGIVSIITGALLGKGVRGAVDRAGLPSYATGRVGIVNGLVEGPGGCSYQMTSDDKLWLGRALLGEVDYRSQAGLAATAWALLQNFVLVRRASRFSTFTGLIRAYAQPCSADWANPDSEKCRNNPQMCTVRLLDRRRAIQSTSWAALPVEIRLFVDDFARGLVRNNVPDMVDYAAFSFDGQQVTIAGNNFGSHPWRNLV